MGSRDNLIVLKCSECDNRNHYSQRNKKHVKEKIELMKFCNKCKTHKLHKEGKMK